MGMKMLNTSIYENRIGRSMNKCKCCVVYKLGNNLIKLIRHRVPNIRMMLLVNDYCVLCFLCHITMLNRLITC